MTIVMFLHAVVVCCILFCVMVSCVMCVFVCVVG
jgi:hypothetical protein